MYNPYGYTIYDTGNKTAPNMPQYAIRFSLCTNIDPISGGLPQCATTYGLNNQVSGRTSEGGCFNEMHNRIQTLASESISTSERGVACSLSHSVTIPSLPLPSLCFACSP